MIGDRWGATQAEILRRYPCDEIVPAPAMQAWRAVTVKARPERVWPWVAQVRLAPYSYDWIDNLGRRSPQHLMRLPEPVAGEPFTTVGGRPAGRIIAVGPGEHLTGQIMGAVLSYVLVAEDQWTRLLLKVVVAHARRVITPLLCLGDLVMARRQLLNLARLAEQSA